MVAPKLESLPDPRKPGAAAIAILTVLATLTGTSGCLSHEYRVSHSELQRLAALPPQQRGVQLRAVQRVGGRRSAPVAADARLGQPPPGYYGDGYYASDFGLYVNLPVQVGPGPGPVSTLPGPPGPASPGAAFPSPPGDSTGAGRVQTARPAGASMPRAVKSAPVTAGSGGGGGGGGGNLDASGLTDDLRVAAVVAIVVATFAAVGLMATEGARYDGFVAVDPDQPVHLEHRDGQKLTVSLAQLTPELVADASHGTLADDEGWGLFELGRAPLDRKGFAFKLEFGSAEVELERYITTGFASNIQIGYFPLQYLGLLGTMTLGFGSDDFNRDFFRNFLGVEAQFFLPGLSIFHLGGYGNFGNNAVTEDSGFVQSRPALGVGALLEIELTTRLALMGRAGYTYTNRQSGGWDNSGLSLTAGIAIY